jgi:hypothetical protein
LPPVPLSRLENNLEKGARPVMPNIPCVGAGAAGFAGGRPCDGQGLEIVGATQQFRIGMTVEENIWTQTG